MTDLLVDPSVKQLDLIAAIRNPDLLHVVASGPKRAGKSYPGNWAWLRYSEVVFSNTDFGMVAASQSRIEALTAELEMHAADIGIHFSRHTRYLTFGTGNRIYWWVSKHSKSHVQIEGHTWGGCLVDEASSIQRECIMELNTRCSLDYSCILYTTNPQHETHPFKLHVMDAIEGGERRGVVLFFGIDDNPSLSAQKKQDTYDGLKHDPMALARDYYGQWTTPGGGMFPGAGRWIARPPSPKREMPYIYNISIDPAPSAVTHALLIGEYSKGRHWVTAEWRHDGREKRGPMPYDKQAKQIVDWASGLAGDVRIGRWRVDPADPAFRDKVTAYAQAHSETGNFDTFVKPDLRPSIAALNAAGGNAFFVSPAAPILIQELTTLQYSERELSQSGLEKPEEGNDDAADCARYHVWDSGIWRTGTWIR